MSLKATEIMSSWNMGMAWTATTTTWNYYWYFGGLFMVFEI